MKETKAKLLKTDLEFVQKRVKILISSLEMELNDDTFDEMDIESLAMDFVSTLTSTEKRVKKEYGMTE